ncbi:hypothetical protein ACFVVX_27960 [Kitasatospora sp. NPDC058170]|uniref:hypothetical protein n=1 Tax=Kitasatospora sp. NPDC058170 TaxID=3346364 RepID=UPI0036D82A4A
MSTSRTGRRVLLAAAMAATLTLPLVQSAQAFGAAQPSAGARPAATPSAVTPSAGAASTGTPSAGTGTFDGARTGYDEVDRLGDAVARAGTAAPAPGGGSLGDAHSTT